MDLFFEIRYGKSHIICEAKESNSVGELKKIVHGITKEKEENVKLFKVKDGSTVVGEMLDDSMTLADAGYNNSSARAQQPAVVAAAFKNADGKFVPEIVSVSDPPPLPDIMRGPTDSASSAAAAAGSQKHEEQAI